MLPAREISLGSIHLGRGNPLFAAFIGASIEHKKNRSRPATDPPLVQAAAIASHANA